MKNFLTVTGVFLVVILCALLFRHVTHMPLYFGTPSSEFRERPDDGWAGLIAEPVVFSSEELSEMIESAPHYVQTRPVTPHPERKMTDDERHWWISEYNVLGGINAQELEMYKIINEIRREHDLPPFILCPRLSMAARLFSYIQVRYHSVGHNDPYYGDLMARSNFFGAFGSIYFENANSQQWYTFPDGRIEYVYLTPQGLVDGWMSSPDHREHILTTETSRVGFGIDSGRNRVVPTMKSLAPSTRFPM
ncbi:MAG: CAP domain-containing protein [Defluviitaleaceae bacterium]|nr:CAP domain-containing protein [Defluviitaleaceae bacterium]